MNGFDKLLYRFWDDIKAVDSANYRLGLLIKYSNVSLGPVEPSKVKKNRILFRTHGIGRKLFKKPCIVCRIGPVIRHHVIALHKGGDNRKWNLVPVCGQCHEAIHPWLEVPRFIATV